MRPRLPDKLRQPNLAGGFLNNLATNPPNLRAIESSVPLLQTGETYILSTQFFFTKMYFDTLGIFSQLESHISFKNLVSPIFTIMRFTCGFYRVETTRNLILETS